MRVTGIIVALIGVGIGMFCGITAMATQTPPAGASPGVVQAPAVSLLLPLIVSGVAVVVGCGMAVFGQRGYIRTKNPEVRN